jgi:membrane-associated phospholipid phosphatase
MLATDSGEDRLFGNKLRGLFTETQIVNTSIVLTNGLKKVIRRAEPYEGLDQIEYEAVPSNHSTPPFTRVALIRRNLRYTRFNDFSRYTVLGASYLLASSSAYGRIEGGLHHFSDQLVGAALGNFIGLTLFDTFLEEESLWSVSYSPGINYRGGSLQFSYAF